MVKIDSGPVEPTYRFADTPKDKWHMLLLTKRFFLATRLKHDCRCLVEFCEEAEAVYEHFGFTSAESMIREGYKLEPTQVQLAVAWLKANGTEKPVGLGEIVPLPTSDQTERPRNPNGRKGNKSVDNVNRLKGGNDTDYTLRRLARDAPEMLPKIEAGELTVNQAAIQAGIRKKATPLDNLRKAWAKASQEEREAFAREVQL